MHIFTLCFLPPSSSSLMLVQPNTGSMRLHWWLLRVLLLSAKGGFMGRYPTSQLQLVSNCDKQPSVCIALALLILHLQYCQLLWWIRGLRTGKGLRRHVILYHLWSENTVLIEKKTKILFVLSRCARSVWLCCINDISVKAQRMESIGAYCATFLTYI